MPPGRSTEIRGKNHNYLGPGAPGQIVICLTGIPGQNYDFPTGTPPNLGASISNIFASSLPGMFAASSGPLLAAKIYSLYLYSI